MPESNLELILKYCVGIVALLLGVILTPTVDRLKARSRTKKIVDNIYLELDDFLNDSSYYILGAYDAYQRIYVGCYAEVSSISEISPVTIMRPLEFYILEKNYFEAFPALSRNERKALKTIMSSVEFINENMRDLRARKSIQPNENVGDYLGLLKSLCILKNTARKLKEQKSKFSWPTESNDMIYKDALRKLSLSDEPQDIIESWYNKKNQVGA